MKQNQYKFTLILDGVSDTTEDLEDQLYEAGCDDALIYFRNGTVLLDFSRQSSSLEKAVLSAIKAIESIPAGAQVISMSPDALVTEAEIAKRLNKPRQSVSLWAKRVRRQAIPFPNPISGLADKSPMWRWLDVVKWLHQQQLVDDITMLESARFVESLNAVLTARDSDTQAHRQHILQQLKSLRSSST
ncbi:MAG: hypothetical protein P1U40_12625 [Coxiellaceae bacterium]|nr:hypothetical protein [Coxiellaceae bacterium]